jgi:NADPH2:quinone reductase
MMLKGLTARYLLCRSFRVEAGHTILVHAAAGGVGLILTQWAKHLGATVIGTVGSPEKAELARQNGCDHVTDYRKEDFAARVKQITNGEGCHVVYDGVGKATFPASLDCLRPLGYFVGFGSASGPIAPFDIMLLAEKGSLFATWQVLPTHLAKREDVLAMSQDLFDVVASGAVKIQINARMPLATAAEAHRRLEARQTTGATVLLPEDGNPLARSRRGNTLQQLVARWGVLAISPVQADPRALSFDKIEGHQLIRRLTSIVYDRSRICFALAVAALSRNDKSVPVET